LSVWQLTSPRPMAVAGGRLFVDVARDLASPAGRAAIVARLGRSDPLIGDALETIVERGDLVAPLPDDQPARPSAVDAPPPVDTDPAIVSELIEQSEASLAELRGQIDGLSGPALLDFVLADVPERR